MKNKHYWGSTGCRCHVQCTQCGTQARKSETADAKPCTDEAREKWKQHEEEIRRRNEARFNQK